jgi:hypothetical protein
LYRCRADPVDVIRIYTEKIVVELVPEVRSYFRKLPSQAYGQINYNTVLNGEVCYETREKFYFCL